jgi:hypothetical protein
MAQYIKKIGKEDGFYKARDELIGLEVENVKLGTSRGKGIPMAYAPSTHYRSFTCTVLDHPDDPDFPNPCAFYAVELSDTKP